MCRYQEKYKEVGFLLSKEPPGKALAKVCARFRCCKFEGLIEEAKDCCYAFGNCCKQAFREYDETCGPVRPPYFSSSSGSAGHYPSPFSSKGYYSKKRKIIV
jgi:hypothetical protein